MTTWVSSAPGRALLRRSAAGHGSGAAAGLCRGFPTTPNGLALCKIHHAAYDQNILGVSPDYKVSINREVLSEVDGPMLKRGLQEMHCRTIMLPARKVDRPDRELLAWWWERFAK